MVGSMSILTAMSSRNGWFQKLRLFLDKKNGFKPLNLYIYGTYISELIELEELNAVRLPPYELEHVELQLDTPKKSSAHMAFVGAVLWCCRPHYLTLKSFFPSTDFEDVVKFVCEKLLQQEYQGHTNIQTVSCPEGKTISFRKKEGVTSSSTTASTATGSLSSVAASTGSSSSFLGFQTSSKAVGTPTPATQPQSTDAPSLFGVPGSLMTTSTVTTTAQTSSALAVSSSSGSVVLSNQVQKLTGHPSKRRRK